MEKEFNYSAINNFAVREAQGEYLLFLNNDVEIITENWLEEMLQLCQQKTWEWSVRNCIIRMIPFSMQEW